MIRYKFLRLRNDMIVSDARYCIWEIGNWQAIGDEPILCEQGYHCCEMPIHAFGYVSGEIFARVECGGSHEADGNKEAWQKMRIVEARHWQKRDSVALAIHAARLVLHHYERYAPEDRRPLFAIEGAEAWLKDPTTAAAAAAHAAAAAAHAAAAAGDAAAAAAYTARAAVYAARGAVYAAQAAAVYAGDGYAAYAMKDIYQNLSAWMISRWEQLEEIHANNQDQTTTA